MVEVKIRSEEIYSVFGCERVNRCGYRKCRGRKLDEKGQLELDGGGF